MILQKNWSRQFWYTKSCRHLIFSRSVGVRDLYDFCRFGHNRYVHSHTNEICVLLGSCRSPWSLSPESLTLRPWLQSWETRWLWRLWSSAGTGGLAHALALPLSAAWTNNQPLASRWYACLAAQICVRTPRPLPGSLQALFPYTFWKAAGLYPLVKQTTETQSHPYSEGRGRIALGQD